MRSGFVGLIGRPNVGKSTLMNQVIGTKVAITSSKPQTTRNMIQGIYNDSDSQIIFVDTPGIHKPKNKLGNLLNQEAYYSIHDVDVILMLVSAKEALGGGDKFILERLKDCERPVILVINKIDGMGKEEILNKIIMYKDLYPFAEIVPVSALKCRNIDTLIKVLKGYLKDEIQYYEPGTVTNKSIPFLLGEMVREKVFQLTSEEIPHSIAVIIEQMEKKKASYLILATIVVDRESLKKIIIGHQGSMIKKIGMMAREDMETMLGCNVYLELFVKVIPKWRDKEKYLAEFGYYEMDENV